MRLPTEASDHSYSEKMRRRIRLLMLLNAAEEAGLAPIKIIRLHAFAYLSNVLAPVWKLNSLDGKVLKRLGGPFFPALQHDLDRLVGMGMAVITGLGHVKDESTRWRLEGSYHLNRSFASPALDQLLIYPEESRVSSFINELAFALAALSDSELDLAVSEDATYSDPSVSIGNIVDFNEWATLNYSANAARKLGDLSLDQATISSSEKVHLYVRHLYKRIQGGR